MYPLSSLLDGKDDGSWYLASSLFRHSDGTSLILGKLSKRYKIPIPLSKFFLTRFSLQGHEPSIHVEGQTIFSDLFTHPPSIRVIVASGSRVCGISSTALFSFDEAARNLAFARPTQEELRAFSLGPAGVAVYQDGTGNIGLVSLDALLFKGRSLDPLALR